MGVLVPPESFKQFIQQEVYERNIIRELVFTTILTSLFFASFLHHEKTEAIFLVHHALQDELLESSGFEFNGLDLTFDTVHETEAVWGWIVEAFVPVVWRRTDREG